MPWNLGYRNNSLLWWQFDVFCRLWAKRGLNSFPFHIPRTLRAAAKDIRYIKALEMCFDGFNVLWWQFEFYLHFLWQPIHLWTQQRHEDVTWGAFGPCEIKSFSFRRPCARRLMVEFRASQRSNQLSKQHSKHFKNSQVSIWGST